MNEHGVSIGWMEKTKQTTKIKAKGAKNDGYAWSIKVEN